MHVLSVIIYTSGNGNYEKYLESKHVSVPLPIFKKTSDVDVYSYVIVWLLFKSEVFRVRAFIVSAVHKDG